MTSSVVRRLLCGELAFLCVILISAAPRALAADSPLPTPATQTLAVAITIDAENLVELYQSVPQLRIIDSRHPQDHRQGYIETSVNLPLESTDCDALSRLSQGRDQAFVFYCNGNAADTSMAAIQIASDCGYRRLFWFRGGFVEWEDKDYPYLIE